MNAISFIPILLFQVDSFFEVPAMKEQGQRRTGVPGRWSLAFLPPEGQVTSNRKKKTCEPFTAQGGEGGASSQSDWGDQDPHPPALGV